MHSAKKILGIDAVAPIVGGVTIETDFQIQKWDHVPRSSQKKIPKKEMLPAILSIGNLPNFFVDLSNI